VIEHFGPSRRDRLRQCSHSALWAANRWKEASGTVPTVRALGGILALGLLAAACSGGGGGEDAAPTAEPTSATPEPPAGATQTDADGNQLTVHGWAPWPNQLALFNPYDGAEREESLYGNVKHAADQGSGLWAIDLEVCAAVEGAGGIWEFVSATGERSIANVEPQILTPVFRWPDAGTCQRGWRGLEAPDGARPAAVRYVAGLGDNLEWPLAEPLVPGRDAGDTVVVSGASVSLPDALAEWTVTVNGWTEVGDTASESTPSGGGYVQPVSGARLVAAQVDWCYAVEADGVRPVPTFGLQVDGWNLMGEFLRGLPWGPGFEPLAVAPPQGCTAGWVAFEIPLGSVPSGVFVSDNNNSDSVWREWHFDDTSELAAPEGGGLPDATAVGDAADACGVTASLEVVRDGQSVDGTIISAAAIPTGPGRLDIYLSNAPLAVGDIPKPADPGVALIALGLEQTDGSPISPGLFTGQVSGTQYGTVSVIPGGESAGVTIFIGATVELTHVTDTHVCGNISAAGGSDTITGAFAAPIWQPPS
jgi:hypothetical protein